MPQRIFRLLAILILITLLLMSCQNSPTTSNEEITDVFVNMPLEPQVSILGTEDFPLPNCGGTSVLSQSLGSLASVSNSSIIGTTAKISGVGEVQVSPVVKFKLQTELSVAYQQTLSNENARTDTIQLSAEPGTYVIYKVQWEQHTYSSNVSYAVGNNVYDVPYDFVLRVPKLDRSDQLPCSGGGVFTPSSPSSVPEVEVTTMSILRTTFEVFANLSWQNSGVEVQSGDKLRIIWDGTSKWIGAPGNPTDPLGGWIDSNPGYACPPQVDPNEAGSSALVAKIGEYGIPTNPFKQIPTGVGYLYFTMNDCDSQRYDNSGSVIITIEITR